MNGRLAQYRYDRSSNRQWRRDAAAHAAGVATEDQWYEYDGLYQVGEFQRGTLSGSYPNFSGITPVAQNQDLNYDAMGNWLGFQSDALNQTRQFNKVNEITSINGPSGVVTPQYDPVGNITSVPAVSNWTTAQTLKWDAWNRLVRISEGSSTIAEYSYDALFRRVTKTVSGTTRRFYYSDKWQILEEYISNSANPEARYWYGLCEINDIVRRQCFGSASTDLYALRDTMNVVALVSSIGVVQQRMAYDAFGNGRFLTKSFAEGVNSACWSMLFHGHYRDADTGLYHMRFRYYHPDLAVFLVRDYVHEEAEVHKYCFVRNCATAFWDPYGLERHHWFVQFGMFGIFGQAFVSTKCPELNLSIHDYTTVYTVDEHRFIHYRSGYTEQYVAALQLTRNCCEFLIAVSVLMAYHHGWPLPEFPELEEYYVPHRSTNEKFFHALNEACKCIDDSEADEYAELWERRYQRDFLPLPLSPGTSPRPIAPPASSPSRPPWPGSSPSPGPAVPEPDASIPWRLLWRGLGRFGAGLLGAPLMLLDPMSREQMERYAHPERVPMI
jgi:RHS repeat-associated protein